MRIVYMIINGTMTVKKAIVIDLNKTMGKVINKTMGKVINKTMGKVINKTMGKEKLFRVKITILGQR